MPFSPLMVRNAPSDVAHSASACGSKERVARPFYLLSMSAEAHMTRTTNARITGFTFLCYIAFGITSMVLFGRAAAGEGIAAKLAGIAQHQTDVRIVIVLGLLQCFSALVLAVTLYALTREQDPDLAMLGMICRVGEGITGIVMPGSVGLLWLATSTGANAPEVGAAHALGGFILATERWSPAAVLFAVGSTFFSWLLLRGRMIPVALAWLGVFASVLLVVILPLQLSGLFGGPGAWSSAVTWLQWLPMLLYEVALALWLLIKGVAAPATR